MCKSGWTLHRNFILFDSQYNDFIYILLVFLDNKLIAIGYQHHNKREVGKQGNLEYVTLNYHYLITPGHQ